jgi:hypothetical protein
MGMILPFGAKPILDARMQGRRPKDMVLISMVGPLPDELNPVVLADRDVSYDWTWVRGLPVCFWTHPKGQIARHILDCSKAAPGAIYVWDCVNARGYDVSVCPTVESIDRPREQWDMRIESLPWLPFQDIHFALGEMECS